MMVRCQIPNQRLLRPRVNSASIAYTVMHGNGSMAFWTILQYTVGILQRNPIQSAILQDLIGQIFATELDFIGKRYALREKTISLIR